MRINKSLTTIAALMLILAGKVQAESYNTAKEQGKEKSSASRQSIETKNVDSVTKSISINNDLLTAYIETFERGSVLPNCISGKDLPILNLGQMHVVSSPMDSYPIWDWSASKIIQISDFSNRRRPDTDYSKATSTSDQVQALAALMSPNRGRGGYITRPDNVGSQGNSAIGQIMATSVPPSINAKEPQTAFYLAAVSFAHHVLAAAGDQLANKQFNSRDEVKSAASQALCNVDYQYAIKLVEDDLKHARCYQQYGEPTSTNGFTNLSLNCGSIVVDAGNGVFRINGRPTLSDDSIDGVNLKASISSDNSRSTSKDKSSSSFQKETSGTTKQRER